MRSVTLSTAATILAVTTQIHAQTSTNCNPLEKTCPPNPGLGTNVYTDFTTGKSNYWQPLEGTSVNYGSNGAQFAIKTKSDAPTMALTKYIMFGHVDLVAKASAGTGIVSSFVLLSQDLDEIDWEWLGGKNGEVQTNFFGKGDISTYDRSTVVPVATPFDSYHTYSIDWTADRIVWSIDGTTVRTLGSTDPVAKNGKTYPQTPMEVKIGNWIGCLDASDPATKGTCEWAGGQTDLAQVPFTMSVKSINVTDYGCGGDYSYSDNSGSWQSIKSTGICDGKGSGPGVLPASATESAGSSLASSVAAANSNDTKPEEKPTSDKPNSSTMANGTTTLSSPASTGSSNKPSTTSNSSTTANAPAKQANSGSNHTYGIIDFTVLALGLGLGYLVM